MKKLQTAGLSVLFHILSIGGLAAAEPTPATAWAFEDTDEHPGLSDPLVSGELVVVGSDSGVLHAFNSASGQEVWQYQHAARIYERPECDERHIYAFAQFDGVVALKRDDGKVAWNKPSSLGYGALAVCPERRLLILGGFDGMIEAYDAVTFDQKWKVDVLSDAPQDPPGADGKRARFEGKPARPTAAMCDDKLVFVSLFDQSRVVGLDLITGAKRFDYQAGGWVFHAAFRDGDRVYIGSQDKSLHCVARNSSKLLWKFETISRIESSAAAKDGRVYFGSCDGGFYCVNRLTGTLLWKFDVETDHERTTAIYSDPLILGDAVCFAAGEGQVYVLDLASGKLRWKYRPLRGAELFSSPATDGTRIFITTRPRLNNMGQATSGKAALVSIDPYFKVIDPFAP
ncbi:MAG TPA: PQQ-binding-like beta-propeller repeat protein [Pirellulales bacterium]|nr:PQQ-binding-like beta-propeller repeat protein [Pirellulales bacterium]HVA46514.1 PQQ-binding-like beta-propeller repeat protein [Pirellulales bacterium]